MEAVRGWQDSFFGSLKYYYFSLLGAYLLVPLSFAYMTASLVKKGINPAHIHVSRETFFTHMMFVAFLSAVAIIPLFGVWLGYLLYRAGIRRSRFDIFFAAAPIGAPVFCFMLGWLNLIH